MTDQTNPANPTGNGGHDRQDYERQDIGVAAVLYFLLGLAVALLLAYLFVDGVYHFLDKRSEAEQAPVNPLVTNAPTDTRKLSVDYKDYLKQNFPSPQLEIDERNQLDKIRRDEEQTLATYDYIDKSAGTIRIPIDRAMDLIAQRGLPVRAESAIEIVAAAPSKPAPQTKKGPKK